MEKRKPKIGEFVLTSKALIQIEYAAEGVVQLKGQSHSAIPIEDLIPSPDGRAHVWVIYSQPD
jgi:hypothetical protein